MIRCIYFVCLIVCSNNVLDSLCHWSWVGVSIYPWQNLPSMAESYVGQYVWNVRYTLYGFHFHHKNVSLYFQP